MTKQAPACYEVDHRSTFRFSEMAEGSVMLVRLSPREDRGQRLLSFGLEIDPAASVVADRDAFGNSCHLFNIHRGHRRAVVHSRTEVETADEPVLPERLGAADWEALTRDGRDIRFWHFLAPSRFARPSTALDEFVEQVGLRPGPDPLTTLRETCSVLHDVFRYTPGSTAVDSPIDHILKTREGVCQDYTHVMIALGRRWGIPSRYVSGYLHQFAGEHESASHAWAEFWLPEIGWVGFDPTHNRTAGRQHIRLAQGRDYTDAAPTRGAVYGGGTERLGVSVSIVDKSDGVISTATDETVLEHPAGIPQSGQIGQFGQQ